MGRAFIAFLFTLAFVAVFTLDSFAFVLLYFFTLSFFVGRWLIDRTKKGLSFERIFEKRAFPGEKIPVKVKLKNNSLLPMVWLHAQELLPLEVSTTKIVRRVFTLGPRGEDSFEYPLSPRKRGVYPIGPLQFSTGDLLGLAQEKNFEGQRDYLIVYPKIIALRNIKLPSNSPLGTLRHDQPIFEDPTRPVGKRNYSTGDSLRKIDWKSSAAVGRLQVKVFEPSIALETVIFLNFRQDDFYYKFRYDDSELAVVAAASIASWIIGQKQTVGLVTNACDTITVSTALPSLPPRKGRVHLMRILENLARAQMSDLLPIHLILKQQLPRLSWGTTIIVVTGKADNDLFDQFFNLRRSGLNVFLVYIGEAPGAQEVKAHAHRFAVPFFHFHDEKDLDIWRF